MHNAIKIPLILLAAGFGIILLLVGAGTLYYFSTTELQVTDADKAVVVGPDALSNYLIAWNAMAAVFNAYDRNYNIVEDDSVITLGDRSRFAYIKYEDAIVGNMFLFVSGNKLYEFTMSGYYIDQAEIWQTLFADAEQKLTAFNQ